MVSIAVLGALLLDRLDLANVAMLFPLGVLFAAIRLGKGPAVLAAFLSVGLLDFFFVHPQWTFQVSDLQYLVTFAVLLAVALISAELADRLRRERDAAEARGEEAARARLAVESERQRNTLLASLSHDLRTPLSALAGLAESLPLAGPPLPPVQAALAEAIRREALRTYRLARDLVDLARLQSEGLQLARAWLPVDELVGAALESRRLPLAAYRVVTDMAVELPLLEVDPVLLERVLGNLLDNAIAHTPAGGTILIQAACLEAGQLALSVCDTGCGLPPGREQAIFERFVRVPGESCGGAASADAGSGLGLAIVRLIVEAHGGKVAAFNQPTGGACFRLLLPVGEQPTPPPAEWMDSGS